MTTEAAYRNPPESKSENVNPPVTFDLAPPKVWVARDRDWTQRKYGSYDAFVVMKNFMLRDSAKLAKAARRRARTVAKRRRAS